MGWLCAVNSVMQPGDADCLPAAGQDLRGLPPKLRPRPVLQPQAPFSLAPFNCTVTAGLTNLYNRYLKADTLVSVCIIGGANCLGLEMGGSS